VTLRSLAEADRFVDAFCTERAVGDARCYKVRLVVEELVSNLFKYTEAREFDLDIGGNESVEITLSYASERLELPTDFSPDRPLEKREEGGVGLYLVRTVSRNFRYEYRDGRSVYRVTV